jgi:hypothetical protein
MKDFDLESQLKSLRVPERDEEYWAAFPERVLAKSRQSRNERVNHCFFMPRLIWACLAAAFFMWQTGLAKTVRRDERDLRASIVRLPDNMSKLMQDEHGLHSLVEDPQ